MEGVLVTASGDGVGPSLLLSVRSRSDKADAQYLFNVPEGFSRFALEHRIRPGLQLRACFVSDLANSTGLPGLLMRLRGEGHGAVEVLGPRGVRDFVIALRHFVHWKYPAVMVSEFGYSSRAHCTKELYEDEFLTVLGVWDKENSPCPTCDRKFTRDVRLPTWMRASKSSLSGHAHGTPSKMNEVISSSEDALASSGRCSKDSATDTLRPPQGNRPETSDDDVEEKTSSDSSSDACSSKTSSSDSYCEDSSSCSLSEEALAEGHETKAPDHIPYNGDNKSQEHKQPVQLWELRGQLYKSAEEPRINVFERHCSTVQKTAPSSTLCQCHNPNSSALLGFVCYLKDLDKILFVASTRTSNACERLLTHPVLCALQEEIPERIAGIFLMTPCCWDSGSLDVFTATLPAGLVFRIDQPGIENSDTLGYISSARTVTGLNVVSEEVFPLPFCWRQHSTLSGTRPRGKSKNVMEKRDATPKGKVLDPLMFGKPPDDNEQRRYLTVNTSLRLAWPNEKDPPLYEELESQTWSFDIKALQEEILNKCFDKSKIINRLITKDLPTNPESGMEHSQGSRRLGSGQEEVVGSQKGQLPQKRGRYAEDIALENGSSNKSAAANLRARLLGKKSPPQLKNVDDANDRFCSRQSLYPPREFGRNMKASLRFLGTGSAEPSKYRGPSSLHLLVGSSDTGILLDCGEGTLGQLVRHYGYQDAVRKLASLRVLWISHRHADHMSGVVELLAHYPSTSPRLLVIGPWALRDWLSEVDCAMGINDRYTFVHCRALQDHSNQWTRSYLRQHVGISRMSCVPVKHCSDSYGIVLHHLDGWRLVYSGDTEPCEALIQAGYGASLLVHEATFEPALEGEARKKRHCTTREAIEASRRMKAQRTVLTHFSQRYPKFPEGIEKKDPASDDKTAPESLMVAFDGMCVPFDCLEELPSMIGAVEMVLASCFENNNTSEVEN